MRDAHQVHPAAGLAVWIEGAIKDFCLTSPDNSLHNEGNERASEEPLVGFSSGADPLYRELQRDIGAPCLTPAEIFAQARPQAPARPDELTVISFVLPKTPRIKEDNRAETTYPARRWVESKHYGEAFAAKVCEHLVGALAEAGYDAVSPGQTASHTIGKSARYGLASTWSERHAAYVSGLGTFGLCDGLITARGKAVGCYSVVARAAIAPTPRTYTDRHASCLFYAQGACGLCIERCPADAISASGHDKERCRQHCFGVTVPYARSHFGIDDYGCGLCQTGVPCESADPTR
jgi:epoxyqueuosine reductase